MEGHASDDVHGWLELACRDALFEAVELKICEKEAKRIDKRENENKH